MGQLGRISGIVCWCFIGTSGMLLVVPSAKGSPGHGQIHKVIPHVGRQWGGPTGNGTVPRVCPYRSAMEINYNNYH